MSNFNARVPLVGLQNRRKNENSSSNTRSVNKINELNGISVIFNSLIN